MKKVVFFVVLVTCLHSARAQVLIAILFGDKLNTGKVEFGITVTPTFTNITNIESDFKSGFNLGIYFNIRPDKKFFLHIEGIAKGTFGATDITPYPTGSEPLDTLFTGGNVTRKIKGFSMPVMLRYKISPKFHAEAGIQPSLVLKVTDIFSAKVNDNELDYSLKVTDEFTKLDFGIAGGLFYKFRDDNRAMGMGIRYLHGLVDVYKPMVGTQANIAWQLVITIPIGAAPKPEKKTEN